MRDISKIIIGRSASRGMIISSGSQVFERSASSRSVLRGEGPAGVEENKDGCWLRYSDSASWWAGATQLHSKARSRGTGEKYFQRTNAAAFNPCQLYRRPGFEESCTDPSRTATPRALTIASRVAATPLEQAFGVVRDHRGHVAVSYSCWFPTHH